MANTPTPPAITTPPTATADVYEPVNVTQNSIALTPNLGGAQYTGAPAFVPAYDADGNVLSDGRWTYTWDGENRLIKMEALEWIQPAGGYLPGNTLQGTRLEFTYDGLSRRTSKKTTRITSNNIASSAMEGYAYDGWNVVMISQLDPTTGAATLRKWSCIWKPDTGSSLYARSSWQQAGGVGGLAWLQAGSAQSIDMGSYTTQVGPGYAPSGTADVHIPLTDHLGNVRHYFRISLNSPNASTGASMSGTPSASLEYDAFGREVRVGGTTVPTTNTPPGLTAGTSYADALPFHFSTKFTDPESGLNYYGYRYYDARDGRWLGRDPMEEAGGKNLYGMVRNNPIGNLDILGLNVWDCVKCTADIIAANVTLVVAAKAAAVAVAAALSTAVDGPVGAGAALSAAATSLASLYAAALAIEAAQEHCSCCAGHDSELEALKKRMKEMEEKISKYMP